MISEKKNNRNLLIVLCSIGLLIVAASIFFYISKNKHHVYEQDGVNNKLIERTEHKTMPVAVEGKINKLPSIDYKNLNTNQALHDLMAKRKKELGLKNSLDMVVKSDESFKVGKIRVSMRDILEKTFLKNKKIFEEQLKESGATKPEKIKEYGIYVVRPGDNIWNIHFRLIREYYKSRGINISKKADEPDKEGFSSGIGKVLKFSEKMVIIYNLLEHKVDTNINLIQPLSKIIVYNMKEIFSFLNDINYKNVDKLKFDGETLWISAQRPLKKGK